MLVVATAGLRAGVEPFATWFYPFAWYSTLLGIEAAAARASGSFFLLARPGFALSIFGWSIPFWLFFELFNFRLANWYYVFVPDHALARWTGILISFATVLPAIFLAERALRVWGPWRQAPAWSGTATAGGWLAQRLGALQAAGLGCLVLPLAWPRLFFPLVWVGVTLIADPWVYRRERRRSLLHDLETGRLGRPVRLLVGGMGIGLLWELFNFGARGKWIYTVPGLEGFKLFEMPLLGFFGFPFLALEGWAVYQALVVAGLAIDAEAAGPGQQGLRPRWTLVAGVLAALFSGLVLRGMEIDTISSLTPRLEDVGDPAARALRASGYGVFDLALDDPSDLAAVAGVDPDRAAVWIEWARLVTLRGIGAANAARLRAAGVDSVGDLAGADPETLAARLSAAGHDVSLARLRIWIQAAARAVPTAP